MPNSDQSTSSGFFAGIISTLIRPFVWLFGYIAGFAAGLVSGQATLRMLEQASNISLPNALPDVGSIVEMFRRGTMSAGDASNLLLRYGYDAGTSTMLLALSKNLLTAPDLIDLEFKGVLPTDQYYSLAAAIGIDKEQADLYLKRGEARLDILTVMSAWRRGFFDPNSSTNYFNDLKAQGWTDDRIELLKQATSFLPPPTDIIRFLLRDVYIPEYVKTYGMDQEYPDSADADFAKVGVDHDTALKYWEAHWELPSISMGFQMYQRGWINEQDLNRLLRAQGIEPYWRDKLTGIAYHPIPRVQIRQFHQYGTLSDDDLPAAYEQIGYSPDNAKKFAAFTIAYNKANPPKALSGSTAIPAEYHGLSSSIILNAYGSGFIPHDEALQFLQDINIEPSIGALLLNLEDAKELQKQMSAETQLIEYEFVTGTINLQQAQVALGNIGLTDAAAAKALATMMRTRRKQSAFPTKAELKKFLEAGTIDAATYVAELRNLGYSDKYIQWYLTEEALTPEQIQNAMQ